MSNFQKNNTWFNVSIAKPGEEIPTEFEGEKWISVDRNSDIYKYATTPENSSKLSLDGLAEVIGNESYSEEDDKYYIACYYGGLNGPGEWVNYLSDIKKLIEKLNSAWIIDLKNDCIDDVFYLTIGFRKEN